MSLLAQSSGRRRRALRRGARPALLLAGLAPLGGCGLGTAAIASSGGGGGSAPAVVTSFSLVFPPGVSVPAANKAPIVDAALADVDGDGDTDLVVAEEAANRTNDRVRVFVQTSDEVFEAAPGGPLGGGGSTAEIRALAVGDLRLDGEVDFVTVNDGTDDVTVLDRSGGAVAAQKLSAGDATCSPGDVAVADLDGDGRLDILVAAAEGALVLRQLANGSFDPKEGPDLLAQDVGVALGVGDLDLDGDLDVAVATAFGELWLFANVPGGLVAAIPPLATSGPADELVVTDIDRDGDADLVAPIFDMCEIQVFRQVAHLAFFLETAGGPNQTNSPTGVAVADVDGDAFPEIVCSLGGEDALAVLRFFGPFGYLQVNALGDAQLTLSPNDVLVEDVDGDGVVDLVSRNFDDVHFFFGRLSEN